MSNKLAFHPAAYSVRHTLILFIITFVIGLSGATAQTIQRVEPPFWWTGMQHPTIQILIQGEGIGDLDVRLKSKDIQLVKVHRADSPNYLFLDVNISMAKPGLHGFELVRGKDVVTSFNYDLKKRKPGRKELRGFDSSDVLYLITPDRFANGDPTNDEIAGMREGLDRSKPFGRHGGDIRGIEDHLSYIKDMGFTAIWLNPVLENDQEQWSYHGYSTTDYYKVDPRFGTNEAYVKLSETARSMGVKLIMDMIENHCGSRHWWMEDLPFKDWLNYQGAPYQGSNHRRTTVHDPHAAQSDREKMVGGWFVPSMPDLNQRNPFMSTYLIQNSIWWVEYAGLAGIRQDTYSYPDKDFMSEWTCRIMAEYPDFNIVAEEWSTNVPTVAYWLRDKVNHDGYTSCLPSAMDFPLNAVLVPALIKKEQWNQGFINIYETLANDFIYPHPEDLVIFPDNHDMSRIFTQVDENYDAYRMAIALILTMRGTPQLYYGTEILMSNPGTDSHGVIRSDFPGGWSADVKNAFNGTNLSDSERNAQDFVRKLLTWRQNKPVIHHGKLTHFAPENGVYVYFRHDGENAVMVVLNKNDSITELALDRFSEVLRESTTGTDIISGESVNLQNRLSLQPMSPHIIDIK